MKISEILSRPGVTLSCEIFPPKQALQLEETARVARDIAQLKPAFISVTYGAAGNVPRFTCEVAQEVQRAGVPALSHLTCINDTKDKIGGVLADFAASGVENVLALRGDLPAGADFPGEDHFTHASDLTAAIKRAGDFCVGGACYPEGHPESPSIDADLDALRRKVDAGADFLTTQMFFDNNVMYNFLYRALRKGIRVPILAGVMPVCRAAQMKRIVALSGASLPAGFRAILDRFGDQPEAMRQAGVAFATQQIVDLVANGVDHIHLYTMNRPEIAREILRNLSGVLAAGEEPAHGSL